MKSDSGNTDSVWMQTADVPAESPLAENLEADVCVIGAGIAGMSTAYLLCQEGRSVIVLDDGMIGGGETGRTTAHLSNALDDRYTELERLHGERGARFAAESHTAAIDMIERIVNAEKIDCDFSRLDGYLFLALGGSKDELQQEMEAAQRAGLGQVRMLDRVPYRGLDTGPCLLFPQQGQFHPLRYLDGLAKGIEKRGGRIFAKTHVDSVAGGSNPAATVQGGLTVRARSIVVATNSPINDRVTIHTKQAPYRTYVVGALVPRGSVYKALYWDTADPYHYVRIQPLTERYDVLIIGGEDHKTGQAADTDERFSRLENWARNLFPEMEDLEYQWSGQVMEPVDAMAFIGRNPGEENVYIATGDSGHGMTHGTIAGMLITDLIQGRENRWSTLYDPARKSLKAVGEFTRENLNVARQYVDRLTGGEVESEVQVPMGEGAVIREGLKKIAVYCDAVGETYRMSAVCPHLGCVVSWNTTEKSWDCPCHGSRFSAMGKVINGPANQDLEAIGEDQQEMSAPVGPITP